MRKEFNITLTYRKLETLHQVYKDVVDNWEPEDDWELLLYDNAEELLRDLRIKIAKELKSYRLVLSLAQARAMWMLWQMVELTGDSISLKVAMDEVVAEVDKHVKHPAHRVQKKLIKN